MRAAARIGLGGLAPLAPGGLGTFPTDYCVAGNVFDVASQLPLLPRGDFFRQ
jgi:hypothetical protein